jgi:eukaryotic-like serine/threonine-protein kinase
VLVVRPVGSVAPQVIPQTDDLSHAFWSADSRQIAFVQSAKLRKVDASGGEPEDVCPVTEFAGGSWNADGTIIFGSSKGLFRVSGQGGKPELITKLETQESGHFWPHFLPDGQHFLFTAWGQPPARGIFVGTLGSAEKKRILPEESNATFVTGQDGRGFLLFQRDRAVFAQPFDPAALAVSGEARRVADDVTSDVGNGRGYFSSSVDGVLVYFQNTGAVAGGAGPQSESAEWHLAWTSRTGQTLQTPGPPAVYRGFEIGPDAKRIAAHRHEKDGGDVWITEPTGAEMRITWDASQHNSSPIWAPDGKSLVFSSTRNGKPGLYRKPSDGSGVDELLFESELPKAPMSWSPDSKYIVFGVQDPKTGADLWVLSVDDKKATPFPTPTTYTETHAQVSPDGKWLAYASDSVGGRREIHVQAFPSGAGHWQVSNAGGDWPRWRKDSKELFYHSIGPVGNPSVAGPLAVFGPLYAVAVDGSGTAFVSGAPYEVIVLRALGFPHPGGDYHTYAVAPDGQSFLYLQLMVTGQVASAATSPDPTSGLMVAMNWTRALKK